MADVTFAHMGGRGGGKHDGVATGAGGKRQPSRLIGIDPQGGMRLHACSSAIVSPPHLTAGVKRLLGRQQGALVTLL
jgi:hypothetical protein